MPDIRDYYKTLLETTFISVKGSKETIYNQMVDFLNKVVSHMPEKLFRYRRIDEKGYSIKSLDNGTITLCKAKYFSDKYDSLIYVDVEKEVSKSEEAIRAAFQRILGDIKRQNPLLRADMASPLCYLLEQGMAEDEIVDKLIKEKYSCHFDELRHDLRLRESRFRESDKTARIACFTESVQSKFMWDTYAGGYSGFALEYNLKEYLISCINNNRPTYVFPVIYTNERPDMTIDEANYYVFSKLQERGLLKYLYPFRLNLDHNILSPHKPFLYKDKEEYGHEKEWRMLYYSETNFADFVEIPDDGCLKAIYYGMDIKPEDQEKLHQIALKKGLKEYKVSIDEDSPKYSLKINTL